MLIAFLLVLLAVKVRSEAVDQDGLRKSRQLEFGLQDIRTGAEETLTTVQQPLNQKNDLINELPTVLSSLSPEIITTQQTFDVKSANYIGKENNLCSQESCNFKGSDSFTEVSKPSRDLQPPFNDLELEVANKATTFFEQTNDEIKTTVGIQTTFTTTTEKPEIKIFQSAPTQNVPRFIKTTSRPKPVVRIAAASNEVRSHFTPQKSTTRPKSVVNSAAATNELRSYLPPLRPTTQSKPVIDAAAATNVQRGYLPPQPEFSGAAQTNVAVVQPPKQNNQEHDHDHHHHHHHGENFNICDDAFHAFLCAPLKARKRITGALPTSLQGQSSFINYQKALKAFDRETSPSNAIRNDYLPPNPSSTNLIQSSYSPPSTTRKPTTTTTVRPYSPPKVIPESSNSNDRFYLPPPSDNSPPVNPQSSVVAFSAITTTKAPSTFRATVKTTTASSKNSFAQSVSPTVPSFNSLSSNENSFYLPPNVNPQPSASFVSTSRNVFPIISTISPVSSTITPVSSTFVPLPSVTNFAPLASNSIFVPQKPIVQPTFPVFTSISTPRPIVELKSYTTVSPAFPTVVSTVQTTPKPVAAVSSFAPQPSNPSGSYLSPVSEFQSSSFSTVSTPLPTVISTIRTTPKPVALVSFAPQPSNPSGSYLPPVSEFRSSSKPVTTTVKPFSPKYSEQPSNADKTYLPPDPNEPAAAQVSSAAVAAPQVKNPFHHGRDLCTDPFHSFLCVSAKPRKRITGQLPSGFSPDSSNTNESRLKPEPSNQDESRIRSDRPLEGSSAQNVGYSYPKPINPFHPLAISSTVAPSTGYSYPKPDKIFPLPSQQDAKIASPYTTKKPEPVLRPSEARVVTGYDYPKPSNIFPLPAEQNNIKVVTTTGAPTTGYSYPKPQKPFPLPSEQKEVRQKPNEKSVVSSTPGLPLPTNTVTGYQYPKPEQSLKLPEKKGYSYPKPEKRLELPTEGRSRFKLPQTSNLDPIGSLGSADFIPVNKVEFKRAESSKLIAGLRRFGERMKKREREALLYRKQEQQPWTKRCTPAEC